MNKKLLQSSFLCALGTVAYIAVVATIMTNAEQSFGEMPKMLAPIAFLTLFVVSAAITGSLVLGRALMMYLDGVKKGAVKQLGMTIAWLAMFLILFFGVLLINK